MIPLLAAWLALSPAAAAPVKNPGTFVELNAGDPVTLDPAWASDTDSLEVILNVYETLFQFDGESLEKLAPLLAEKVPTRRNGLISKDGRTYTIPIRKGVLFQDGSEMTPDDVRYSFLRFMLRDRAGGPSSALLEPLLGYASLRDGSGKLRATVWADADRAVRVKGDSIVLRLPRPRPGLLAVMAARFPVVVSRAWAAKNGDWDGGASTWTKFVDQQKQDSPFFARANGTGAFALARWDQPQHEIVLSRHERYWRGPARLKTVVLRRPPDFNTSKLMLQAGDADDITADLTMESQLRGLPGVVLLEGQPDLGTGFDLFFTFHADAAGNRFIGSGKLDGEGVPPDLFADEDARKGFAYSVDYKALNEQLLHGRGRQSHGCIPPGVLGYDAAGPQYRLDPALAERHLRRALGGRLWDKGFKMTIGVTDDMVRLAVAQDLKKNLERMNPRFKIDVVSLDWPAFLDAYRHGRLPAFVGGFSGKSPDPDNFAVAFMHSRGIFPLSQGFSDPESDRLIEAAREEADPGRRRALYVMLQRREFEEAPHVLVSDVVRFRAQRAWVHGWVNNPIFPGAPYSTYFYPVWKQ